MQGKVIIIIFHQIMSKIMIKTNDEAYVQFEYNLLNKIYIDVRRCLL